MVSVPERIENVYLIDNVIKIDDNLLNDFISESEYLVSVVRKRKTKKIDARKQVVHIDNEPDGRIRLISVSETGKAGLKPLEIVSSIGNLSTEEAMQARVLKIESRPLAK
jgi:hypothetical protein